MTLTRAEVAMLVDACTNRRDRFIVEALHATGLRLSELCGLHLSDLHLVPSSVHLGCTITGAHLHVERREDNENGALAKSVWPRAVPVGRELVLFHDAYRAERDALAEATASDYLLVNCYRPPLGRALR
ncbi:transposase A, partial [mine drainage metagenome]